MKPIILYGIIFFVAFLLVTGAIFFIADSNPAWLLLSSNIEYAGSESEVSSSELDGEHENSNKSRRIKLVKLQPTEEGYTEIDTIKGMIQKTRVEVRHDTIYTPKLVKDKSVVDSLNKKILLIKSLTKQNSQKDARIKSLKMRIIASKDSAYRAWIKSTVKLYEAMSSQEAAKLIKQLSDDQARDLIYKMKNKKAAAILANLDTELVVKLTKAK